MVPDYVYYKAEIDLFYRAFARHIRRRLAQMSLAKSCIAAKQNPAGGRRASRLVA